MSSVENRLNEMALQNILTIPIIPEVKTGELTKTEFESERVKILKLSLMDRLKNESINPLEPVEKQAMKVKSFGYEVEGGFDFNEEDNDWLKGDGSVNADGFEGEIASPIFKCTDRESFYKFVKNSMPDNVNSSCGLHVHLSFNNEMAYQRCMDKKYYDQFLIQVNRFFNHIFKNDKDLLKRFNDRFNGNNTYCRKRHMPLSQAMRGWYNVDGNECGRYTMLNYPYMEHKTIECRLFPSTISARKLVLIVEWFIKFTNSYLKTCALNERAIRDSLRVKLVKPTQQKEVMTICV